MTADQMALFVLATAALSAVVFYGLVALEKRIGRRRTAVVAALVMAVGLYAVLTDHAAAKDDPWQTKPADTVVWQRVLTYVRTNQPQLHPSRCGASLDIRFSADPRLPTDYTAQHTPTDTVVKAGAPVGGYYSGPPEKGMPWVPGVSCVIEVKTGDPLGVCERLWHERLHDMGYNHGDDVPGMNGQPITGCHTPAVQSMYRYWEVFARVDPGTRCRQLYMPWPDGRRMWCRVDRRTVVWMDFTGEQLLQ